MTTGCDGDVSVIIQQADPGQPGHITGVVGRRHPVQPYAFADTRDLDRALRLADDLETGIIGVNTVLGREGGAAGIDEHLETR